MSYVNVEHEVSYARYSSRVTVRGVLCCNSLIGLLLHMGYHSDVSSTVRLKYSVSKRYEGRTHVDIHGSGLLQNSWARVGFGVWEGFWC